MDLVLRGRGTRITDNVRSTAAHKLARLSRMDPRLTRLELEVITEPNPRQGGGKRIEASLQTPRKTFRATAEARDVEAALDQLVERLERQLRDHHGKRRNRMVRRPNRLESAGTSAEEAETSP